MMLKEINSTNEKLQKTFFYEQKIMGQKNIFLTVV